VSRPTSEAATGHTIGVVGGAWRARVAPGGALLGENGSVLLDWWVAAEDRWHTPSREVTRRQRLVGGVPVVETAVRVPGGDAVQTVYAVADRGGLVVVAIDNRSPAPIAVALSRRDILTSHAPATVPVRGGEAPPGALVLPVGHRSSVVLALAPDDPSPGPLPAGLPSPDQVVRGWLRQTEAGADLRLPPSPAVALPTLRSKLLLEGPPPPAEPVPFLVAVAELGRLGLSVEPWLDDVAAGADRLALSTRRRHAPVRWSVDTGLVAAGEIFGLVDHRRGVADVAAARRRRPEVEPTPPEPVGDMTDLAWALRRVAVERAGVVDLFPAPFPAPWRGQPVEAYRVPVGPAVLGVALRWHGTRPAVLWELDGPPVELRSSGLDPSWAAGGARGEALLADWASPSTLRGETTARGGEADPSAPPGG
jgi:hypothetical protein